MIKNAHYKILKGISLGLSMGVAALPTVSGATTFATMTTNIFNSNSSEACIQCHHSSLTLGNRHSAPIGADFDIYSEAAARVATMDSYVSLAGPFIGYMPMDPGQPDFTDAANLDPGEMAIVADWLADGAPLAAATAVTDPATSIAKTTANLRGDFNTNVFSATTVPGSYHFSWGLTTSYGVNTSSTARSLTSTTFNQSHAISGLTCGTTYNFRARATNGNGTGSGSNRSFNTDACTDPVMAGLTIVADATSQSATEDSNANFALTVTDDDPGNLTWSKTNGTNGAVSLISATTSSLTGSVTVRYLSNSNYFGSDSFTVTVTNGTTGTSQLVTFNMTVNDDNSDAPIIAGTTTVNNNEDGVNAADGALTPISVSVSASDTDNSPTYNWDVTVSNDGTPSFSVANVAAPTLSYTPLANDNGTPADSFTIRVCDGGSAGSGNCDTQVITVNLTAQQDTPVAINDTGINVLEGAPTTLITVVGNDTDADAGQTATLIPNLASISVTPNEGLSLIGVSGNQIEVAHDGRELPTTTSLTYQVQDVNGRVSALAATVSITITGTDDPPTSANITVAGTVDEGTSTIVNAIAVSNDPENATMAVCNTMTAPVSGNAAVTINGGGNIVYTHDGTDIAGTEVDTFTYQVNDANDSTCSSGNNSGFSTVTVNLVAVNDAPVAVADSISIAEGGVATILVGGNTTVLQNDTDEENGVGTGFTVSSNSTPGFTSGFTLNANGTFSYAHDDSENFSTSFTYTVNDGALNSAAPGTVTINITPVNDAPVITSVAPTAALVLTEKVAANVYQLTQTDVDDNAFTYSLGATGLPGDVAMAINASGQVTWTPSRTGNFNQATAMVTVTVTDASSTEGGNNKIDTQMFNIATTPLDTDSDGVAEYADNCPAAPNAGQADLDNDTTHILPQMDPSGIPANGDVDPAGIDANGFVTGGDACDEDEDGDGIPDSIEDNPAFPFLDSRDAADAALDEDGDGLSNLDEYNNDNTGATIDSDSVGPIVSAPDDVTIDATGLSTVVDIGTATGNDGNDGEVTLFKVALNETVADCTALSDLEADIESFRPGSHTVTWATCDSNGNLGTDDQSVNVKPLVSMAIGQFIGEGQAVSLDVVLNGDAIAYPATVDYTFAGTATIGVDHDGVAGTVTFAAKGEVGTISFNTTSDVVVEDDETVTVTLSAPFNIALSNAVTHTVTITEANVAPQVSLNVTQPAAVLDTNKGNTLYTADGLATIIANATDGNGNALTYDWSATDTTLFAAATITNGQFDFDPSTLAVDTFYQVSVTVSDGQSPITVDRLLLIKTTEINTWLIGQDDDGDGVDNLAEGYGDEDGDGIPNYLDNLSTPANAIENHTANLETSVLIETNPGLHIALGETAIASGATGVLIGLQDIANHGGPGGAAVTNAATDYTFLSSLLNFEISGLTESIVSVNVVVPLQAALQVDAVVRKYNSTGWFDFVVDDLNELRTASGIGGTCPQPGSVLYTVGLTPGHLCLQLTIQDGGANDADGVRNFIVKDPAGLALAPEPEEDAAAESSGSSSGRLGSTSLWFMLVFLACTTYLWQRRKLCQVKQIK